MRKILTALMTVVIAASCSRSLEQTGDGMVPQHDLASKLAGSSEGDMVPGSLLVKFDSNASTDEGEVPASLAEAGVKEIRPALRVAPKNIKVAEKYGLLDWHELVFDESEDIRKMAMKAAQVPFIEAVQYNTVLRPVKSDHYAVYEGHARTKAASDLPFDDPMLADQWNLHNTGDRSIAPTAVEGADVGVKDAWKLTAGDPRIIVAVFDEGVMVAHPDLKNAMWVNDAEKNGTSGTDDDGNGYVDDVNGYNFAEDKGRPSATGNQYTGHGTHVAGIIAATNNNGIGVSSIAGGSGNGDGVRIMSCQIFRKGQKAADKTVSEAFIYAADHGASIAQCSYGSEGGAIMSDEEYINGIKDKTNPAPLEYMALQYFMDPENSNCDAVETNIAVFAAGNNSGPASSYPGALPFCISVTAFGPDYLPGGYSNRGPGCDIAAPGGDPWIAANLGVDQQAMILSTGVSGDSYSSAGYVYNSGTSMACPHVSGVVALGMSYALKLGKTFSREEFTSMLLTSVNSIDHLLDSGTKPYNYSTFELSSYKGQMGTGAVDAWKFLNSIEGIPSIQTVPGKEMSVDLENYLGGSVGNMNYSVEMDDDTAEALGIVDTPVISEGRLIMTCTKTGSGRIILKSSVGKDTTREDGISGLDFSREVSIVSRPFMSSNGGWF